MTECAHDECTNSSRSTYGSERWGLEFKGAEHACCHMHNERRNRRLDGRGPRDATTDRRVRKNEL